ncbi:hypothetical protein FJZ31_24600 [Candidatus Poribacteria bacterium]|nr:hypothetical protein [Candidatus Poribacteria bacterium]
MNPDKWAVTLRNDEMEKLEDRVALIVEFLAKHYQPSQWVISDIDATGCYGGSLTRRLNDEGSLCLSSAELLDILKEDGQVIDLDAVLVKDDKELFRILIRDGISVDALGTGNLLPSSALKNYDEVDTELFLW